MAGAFGYVSAQEQMFVFTTGPCLGTRRVAVDSWRLGNRTAIGVAMALDSGTN